MQSVILMEAFCSLKSNNVHTGLITIYIFTCVACKKCVNVWFHVFYPLFSCPWPPVICNPINLVGAWFSLLIRCMCWCVFAYHISLPTVRVHVNRCQVWTDHTSEMSSKSNCGEDFLSIKQKNKSPINFFRLKCADTDVLKTSGLQRQHWRSA